MSRVTDPGLELFERMDPIEGFSMEYIRGEIVTMATPNTIHNRIVSLVRGCFPGSRFEAWTTQAVAITARGERPDPDLTVTHVEHADDYFKALPSELVLFTLEVVSTTRPSIRRDYDEKPEIYAQGGIPVYLLVDPNDGSWWLHSELDAVRGQYRTVHKGVFGEAAHLPDPCGVDIPTERFRRYPTDGNGDEGVGGKPRQPA